MTIENYKKYSKLGGWLLLFTIQMILWCISHINKLMSAYMYISGYELYFLIDISPLTILVISLILLFKKTKTFIYIYYIFSVVSALIFLFINAQTNNYGALIGSLVWPILWCIYLSFSKRVKVYTGQIGPPDDYLKSTNHI